MTVVIDASVFNKLFLQEEDKDKAVAFIRSVVKADRKHVLKTEQFGHVTLLFNWPDEA